MYLPWNIIAGNLISLFAGIFVIFSLWVNDDKKAYKYQILNAFILIIASFFFNSYVGMVVMAMVTIRLCMVYKERFSIMWAIFFVVLSTVIGFAVNNLGLVGLIPIIATVQITICNYLCKDIKWIKLSFIINESFYIIYFWCVFDFTSVIIQLITVSVGCISFFKLIRNRRLIDDVEAY
ncbi:YgjV family protein [Methanobrevibacter sp.]|uniref:YgjV family protein n=1 Tax=Methanobrevibacter sp. TaxID=66852 RepID=UPI00386ECFE0